MSRYYNDRKKRPSVILDAGYVSVRSDDVRLTSKLIGLNGIKLICVIVTVFLLILISLINLICLIRIMHTLDWSPFNTNGSKIFRFDKNNEQVELYDEAIFDDAIYTMNTRSSSDIDLLSDTQIDIYGDSNSILFDRNQIALNTEYFYINNRSLIDFNKLDLLKFDRKNTRIHLNRINSRKIQNDYLNINVENNLSILNVNNIYFSAHNLTIQANRHNRQSLLRFRSYPKTKKLYYHRQKISHGNIDFRADAIYLNLLRLPLTENTEYRRDLTTYRICICNTTLSLLRSFSYQPCPLC